LTELTVYTVHSAGLSANSTGLLAKSAGIHRLCISLFTFSIKWISASFYQILSNLTDFFKNRQNRRSRFFSLFKHCIRLVLYFTSAPLANQLLVHRCTCGRELTAEMAQITRARWSTLPLRLWLLSSQLGGEVGAVSFSYQSNVTGFPLLLLLPQGWSHTLPSGSADPNDFDKISDKLLVAMKPTPVTQWSWPRQRPRLALPLCFPLPSRCAMQWSGGMVVDKTPVDFLSFPSILSDDFSLIDVTHININ
jgi:hypothetical protein